MNLLWTAFLNSYVYDWRGTGRPPEDRLDRPGWLTAFLSERGLPPLDSHADLAPLKELRSLLRRLSETLSAGGALGPDDLATLNGLMAGGPVIRQLGEDHHLQLKPVGQDLAQLMAEIAASFAQTLAEGEGARVRVCDNPDCLWVFYDDTRNRTKRFCDDKACGNLMKVRRFRARQKQNAPPS